MQPGECPFCEIIEGRSPAAVIRDDASLFSFLDNRPASPGHTIIATRAHVPDLFSLDEKAYAIIMEQARLTAGHLREVICAPAIGLVHAGLHVRHAHLHLVPVREHSELTTGMIMQNRKPPPPFDDLLRLAGRIRTVMTSNAT